MANDENPIHIWQNVRKHLSFPIVCRTIIGAVVGSISLSSIYFAQVAYDTNQENRSFWGLFLIGAAMGALLGYLAGAQRNLMKNEDGSAAAEQNSSITDSSTQEATPTNERAAHLEATKTVPESAIDQLVVPAGWKIDVTPDRLSIVRNIDLTAALAAMVTLIAGVFISVRYDLSFPFAILYFALVCVVYPIVAKLLDEKLVMEVSHGQLRLTWRPIPWSYKSINVAEIAQIYCAEIYHPATTFRKKNSPEHFSYDVKLLTKRGKRKTIAKGFLNKDHADTLECVLESFLKIEDQPETTEKRHYRIGVIFPTAFSAAVFWGLLTFYLYVVGFEKSTSEGITILYYGQWKFLYGSAIGLVGAANSFATIYSGFFQGIDPKKIQWGFKKALLFCTWLLLNFSFLFSSVLGILGWIRFSQGLCDWIRIDSDRVTSGFFITTRSMRFDQIKEVDFTEVRTEYTKKDRSVGYGYSPTVEFTLSSSEKVTWSGYPLIYVEQEFQQMLELKEIPCNNLRSQSYLSHKNESSNATQANPVQPAESTEDYVARMRAKRDLEAILGTRWRYFSNIGNYYGEEMIIEFRGDMTGTIQVKSGRPPGHLTQTVVDTQMTFEVVSERYGPMTTLRITLSDESVVNASVIVGEENVSLYSTSATGQLAEKLASFFVMMNRFKRQQLRRKLEKDDVCVVYSIDKATNSFFLLLGKKDDTGKPSPSNPVALNDNDRVVVPVNGSEFVIRDGFLGHSEELRVEKGTLILLERAAYDNAGTMGDRKEPREIKRAEFKEFSKLDFAKVAVGGVIVNRALVSKIRDFLCDEGEFAGRATE